MFIILFLISIIIYIGYINLTSNIKAKHHKNEQILFYKIQTQSSKLLSYLLYEYSKNKQNILNVHKKVQNYIEQKNSLVNLDDIYQEINKGLVHEPYNIYITDENLKIVNTTFKPDLGFDLSFAKKEFDKHKKENVVGISAPVFETYSKNFFSFTDAYLKNSSRLMQVSYKYDQTNTLQKDIKDIINQNEIIADSNAYIVFEDGYVSAFMFKEFESKKINKEAIKNTISKAKQLSSKLKNLDLHIEKVNIENTEYKNYYFRHENPIFKDAKIVYSVKFKQESLNKEIKNINILTIFLVTIFLLSIYFLLKMRDKELSLTQKDTFIKYSVHEIKTPLSIISLNNQLREKTLGEDKYTKKINSAIKTLKNSYEDMSFFISQDYIDYDREIINLKELLKNRVEYFNTIAIEQGRKITLKIKNDLLLDISKTEISRLIDNNLSNAIKYSKVKSIIKVELIENSLRFSTQGKGIQDTKAIFEKYRRYDNSTGGHGLGLSIVKDVALKNSISIDVSSKNGENIFEYTFNCHSDDIS